MIAPALWLAGAIAIAQQSLPAPASTPTIQGRIVADDNAAPIPRARVTVIAGDRPWPPAFSDADGRFVATVPARGTFRLRVAKGGFITRELAATRSTAVTEVVLARGAVISGRLVSADGEPVTGTAISVRPAGGPSKPGGAASATTDDLGEFRVAGLLAGRYLVSGSESISCRNEGNFIQCLQAPPGSQEVDLRQGQEAIANLTVPRTDFGTDRVTTVDLDTIRGNAGSTGTAAPTGVIRGRVTANGGAVAGVPVSFAGLTSNGLDVIFASAVTDAQGHYEIREVPAGRLRVSAGRSGSFPSLAGSPHSSTILLAEGEQVDNVNISIARRGVITGTIVDEAGEPIEGLTVRAMSARFQEGRLRLVPNAGTMRTNDRGQYRIFGLSPGSYHIVASDAPSPVIPGGPPVHASLQVFYPGRTSAAEALPLQVDAEVVVGGIDLMFAPYRGGRILGQAQLSSGRPFNGTAVLVHSARTGALASEPRAVPIQDGRFEFLHVAPGDYVVQAAAWKTWEVSEEFGAAPVRVGGEEAASLGITTTPPSTLSGTIRLEGEPGSTRPSDFQLRTLPADPDFALALPSVEPALLERVDVRVDGRFTITGLVGPRRITATAPAGWWLKSAVIDGINAADDPFAFGPGAAGRANVDVVFASGAVTISGRVTNARAEPLAGYPVVVFPADASRIYHRSRYLGMTYSDRSGRFTVPNLPPGDYSVVAVDAALEADDWQHPGVLNALSAAARRVTARQGARPAVDLQPAPLAQ